MVVMTISGLGRDGHDALRTGYLREGMLVVMLRWTRTDTYEDLGIVVGLDFGGSWLYAH